MANYTLNPGVSFNQGLYSQPDDGVPVTPHAISWKVLLPAIGGCCDGGSPEVQLATSYLKLGWDVAGNPSSGTVTVTMPDTYSLPVGRTIQVYAYEAVEGCCGNAWNEYIGTVIGDGDLSDFVSQTVNLAMYTSGVQQVTVNFQNIGNVTWDSEAGDPYNLGSQNGQDNTRWGTNRVSLPSNTPPGATASFVFNVTAPGSAATYAFQWRMVHDAVAWFGETSTNQNIVVSAAPSRTPGRGMSAAFLSGGL